MPAPTVTGGMWLHGQGNSIMSTCCNQGLTPCLAPPGGYIDQVNALLTPGGPPAAKKNGATVTGVRATFTGVKAQVNPTVPGFKQVIWTFHGTPGANAQQILADLPSTLYQQVPVGAELLFYLEDGINDAYDILNGGETIADFINYHHQIYVAVLARYPTAVIADMSCLCLGEIWNAGPAWGANPADVQILQVDNAKQAEVALHTVSQAIYVDYRTPLLALEPTINPAKDPGGHAVLLEGNNVHPTTLGMLQVYAPVTLSTIPVVP